MTPTIIDLVARLEERAKKQRGFVEHAEANRDGWFATMPPEVSADALAQATLDEEAASTLQALAGENEKLRAAIGPFAALGIPFVQHGDADDSPWAKMADTHRLRLGAGDIGWNFVAVGDLRKAFLATREGGE